MNMNTWYWFNTKQKLKLAKIIYQALHLMRGAVGKSDKTEIVRDDICYQLDLSQGIDLGFYLGIYERSTREAIRRLIKKGDYAFDVGANIGLYTFFIARLVGDQGKVISFEPTNYAFQRMFEIFKINPEVQKVILLERSYLTDDPDIQKSPDFYSSWSLQDHEGKHHYHFGEKKSTQGAKPQTLDFFMASNKLSKINLVKIDVDGFECKVIRGGLRTLDKFKPYVVSEICPYTLNEAGDKLEDYLMMMKNLGYRLFSEDKFREIELKVEKVKTLIPQNGSINVVFSTHPLS